MTTSAKTTFATKIQYGDAATPELFTTLAEVRSIEPGEQSADPIEATTHDSAAVEFIPGGITDYQETAIEALFVNDASDTAVRGKLAGAASNWQICYPNWGVRTVNFTANASNEQITATTHGLTTGQPFRVSSSVTLPLGLSANTTYYARWVSADIITAHATNADAVAGSNAINIQDAGSGTHTLRMGTRLSFSGLVTKHKFGRAVRGEPHSISLTLRITGAVAQT